MKHLIFVTAMLSASVASIASLASAAPDHCAQYSAKPSYTKAIHSVAAATLYSIDELCTHPALADIYVDTRTLYNEKDQPIPHTWVTLHYAQHSCQYFVRDVDQVITNKNCYNTW